jgi:uncharacterized membrane protein
MIGPLVLVVVLANGLAAGVLLSTQLGGWPLLRSLPADRYVQAHAFFSTRYDPWMPICLLCTLIGDAVLAVLADPAVARVLFALAAVLALATGVISLTKNVPVNRLIRTFDPDHLPADFASRDPRPGWGRWNRRRSVLGMLAFVINCTTLAWLV